MHELKENQTRYRKMARKPHSHVRILIIIIIYTRTSSTLFKERFVFNLFLVFTLIIDFNARAEPFEACLIGSNPYLTVCNNSPL